MNSTINLPPLVPGLPFIGNGLGLIRGPIEFMAQSYQKIGPVYRLRIPGHEITVLAGMDANRLLMDSADEYFRLSPIYGKLVEETNSELYLPAQDEPEYSYYRKMIRPRLGRETLAEHLPQTVRYISDIAQAWRPGQLINVMELMTRLCIEIISQSTENTEVGDHLKSIILFTNRLIGSGVAFQSASLLKRPDYLEAKQNFEHFLTAIVDRHRQPRAPEIEQNSDFVDLLLNGKTLDGKALTGHDLLAYVHLPYVNGVAYAPRISGYLLYELLKNPELLTKVRKEVDEAFSTGTLDMASLRKMRWLYGSCMETLRMYPIAGALPRYVVKTLNFGGCTIPQGTRVFIAGGVAHFLPENYPDPFRFDPERYFEPRNEHHTPGAFAPYGLGGRTCLSAGMGESLIMVIIATLLHATNLELTSPNFKLKSQIAPIPGPHKRFAVRMLNHRSKEEPVEAF